MVKSIDSKKIKESSNLSAIMNFVMAQQLNKWMSFVC